MLTVLTWLWAQPDGRATYMALHVNIWADMVRRHLTLPHRLACVTDMPEGIDPSIEIIAPPRDFEDVRIPTWTGGRPQCLRRIAMFRHDAGDILGERFVSMDMDCVIAGSLDPLFSRDEDIVLYASPGQPPDGRPYNGSMLMMTAGARPQVYEQFTPEGAIAAGQRYAGSDQAWISHVLGAGEAVWDESDGVAWWGRRHEVETRLMFHPGHPKPWNLLDDPWVREHYRRAPQGRGLILGYGPHVWTEAEAALETGAFDGVIASPEAAAHWPTPVTAVAQNDNEADRLADLCGFSEVVWCGRSERVQA